MKFNYNSLHQFHHSANIWSISILILLLNIHQLSAQSKKNVFHNYTTNEGLPINSVKDITQDSLGFMWFATEEGLARFDGYNFKIFKNDPENLESVRSTVVTHVLASRTGNIWVGSFDGLDSFDPKSEVFTHLDFNFPITQLYEDSNEILWISTPDNGVYAFNPKDNNYSIFQHDPKNENSLNGNFVKSNVYEDSNGTIWIGAGGTLQSINLSSGLITKYPIQTIIRTILEDNHGNLWLCDESGALIKFNRYNNNIEYYLRNKETYGSASDWLSTLFKDSKQNFWIGTGNKGLIFFNSESGETNRYVHNSNDKYSISSNTINDIYEDRTGNLWIATRSGGINIIESNQQPFTIYSRNPNDSRSLSANHVTSFFERPNGDMWIGTMGGGLNLFKYKDRTFTSFPSPNWGNNAGRILEDSQGYVWFGGGFKFKPPHLDKLKNYNFQWILSMLEDSEGIIWVGFMKGLARYDRNNDQFSMYTHYDSIENSLSNEQVISLYEDRQNRLWIGTKSGLDIYNRKMDNFNNFNNHPTYGMNEDNNGDLIAYTKDGIFRINADKNQCTELYLNTPHTPSGSLIDNNNNYWISTKSGDIIRFNLNTMNVIEFDIYHDNEFNYRSQYLSSSGEMYFGGNNGFVVFHPDSIKENLIIPPILITNFKLFNQTVPVEGTWLDTLRWTSPISESIIYSKEIILPYHYNIFSLEFAALNYIQPERNQYQYKLDGFNDDWIYTDANNRIATYTNLNPGNYVFTVKGSNNDGLWNDEGKSIQITIIPPWFMTWWAYVIYTLGFFAILWFIVSEVRRRDKMKARLQLEHLELRKMQELDQMKTQFFANISHEFRTPLTLILGPLKQMYDGIFNGDPQNVYEMMIRNGNRLLKLINQLLDFSKLEAGVIPLQAVETDFISFSKMIFANFETTAQTRNIRYFFQSDTSELMLYLDLKHMEKVILNLLSNAFKFTQDKGEIFLKISKNIEDNVIDQGEGIVEMQVVDTGIGIESDNIPYIFDRFYQVEGTNTKLHEGTGIGLALVKELVKLHHGSVHVVSNKGIGTTFIIHLALGKSHLKSEELSISKNYDNTTSSRPYLKETLVETELHENNIKIILIVEDNPDMRKYIQGNLSESFQIIEAKNGEDGLNEATNVIPDLIISDVMMPKMDGYELCQKLKTDERTSHIPVILLTAKADKKSKLEGLEIGADDYLIKPFNMEELQIRIQNLIEQRERLRQRFGKDITLQPKDLAITSADEKFLNRAIKIIDENIEETEFNAEQFSREIGLSRSQLHRKLKALTDQSAIEFIRSYRLNYSRQLLDKKYGNVAEISYAVGFNNPSYFAECFKKQFGYLPSKMLKGEPE